MLTRQELLNMKKIPAPESDKFMENINYLLLLFKSLCQVYQFLELKYEFHLPGKNASGHYKFYTYCCLGIIDSKFAAP